VNEQIVARNSATFLAQIGPSGNERGYVAITGVVSNFQVDPTFRFAISNMEGEGLGDLVTCGDVR